MFCQNELPFFFFYFYLFIFMRNKQAKCPPQPRIGQPESRSWELRSSMPVSGTQFLEPLPSASPGWTGAGRWSWKLSRTSNPGILIGILGFPSSVSTKRPNAHPDSIISNMTIRTFKNRKMAHICSWHLTCQTAWTKWWIGMQCKPYY